jgi:putative DNA primase/helicase
MLAFWSGKNKEQMDRLFRNSGLFREKWDTVHHASGATYGQETLDKSIEVTENVYSRESESVIFEHEGRYYRTRGESVYPITNFIIQPVEMIVSEDETQMTADLITIRDEIYRQTFMTTDFNNIQKFKNILNRRTISLGYFGSEGDLELLKGYISEMEWVRKTGVKALGIYEHGGRMVYVSTDGAIESKSTLVSVYLKTQLVVGSRCNLRSFYGTDAVVFHFHHHIYGILRRDINPYAFFIRSFRIQNLRFGKHRPILT